jgi:tetratricopeptide (TPR) repeat protein
VSRKQKPSKGTEPRAASIPVVSKPKRRLFRWTAAVVLPLLFLLGVELVLRLIGSGYPTHFFVPAGSGSPGIFEENQKFGWRFFPRRLARAPDPLRLWEAKPANTRRIFIFGESAALGDPEPAYGFSRILRELLEARCPGTRFEVINTGMTAIDSHAILPIARDCVRFQGDIWILYMGNNEVVGPFGAGSVFGAKSPPLLVVRASLALRRTALGQLLDTLWQSSPARSGAPAQWEGMKMMLDQQIRATDPALRRVYSHFARNLSDILSAATRAGAKAIVSSVSSNLKDCAPFASLNRADLMRSSKDKWQDLLTKGVEFESRKEYGQALVQYRQAADIDDTCATLVFRMARCYLTLGEIDSARKQYAQARDLDALRFRADSLINRIIQDTCASRAADGVRYFDSESALTNACQWGIPGMECFWDHVHFNFTGNYLVARALADQVLLLLPELVRPPGGSGEFLTEDQCAERLAFTDWDQRSVVAEMLHRVKEPPFSEQLDDAARIARWAGRVTELDRKLDAGGMANAIGVYRDALRRRPDDWILHHRLAFLLEASGDLSGAAQHWQSVTELVPECVEACYKLGDMCARQGKPIEAESNYRRVLELRPSSFEAMNGLGLLLMDKGQPEEAARLFAQALRMNPKFAQVHVNLGLLDARLGKLDAAEAHYREALRCDPESVAALINLGNLLAARQKYAEAMDHYLQALRVRSNQPAVHLAVANSLAALGRGPEAVSHYREAIRLDPGLAEAHFNLGVALAKQGNLLEATTSFDQACRLNPNDAQAHLDLGVALAKLHRVQEAITEFQTVLRLDPGNGAARHYLESAQGRPSP